MRIVEKDLEDMIYNAYAEEGGRWRLSERGLELGGYMLRQLPLQNGTRPDLVTFENGIHSHLKVQVIELKKGPVDFDTFKQAYGYKTLIHDLIKHRFKSLFADPDARVADDVSWEIVLIGSSVSDELGHLTHEYSGWPSIKLSAYTYRFDAFDGLAFNKVEYIGYKDSAFERRFEVVDYNGESFENVIGAYVDCIYEKYIKSKASSWQEVNF